MERGIFLLRSKDELFMIGYKLHKKMWLSSAKDKKILIEHLFASSTVWCILCGAVKTLWKTGDAW
jgi:hypothetical protein